MSNKKILIFGADGIVRQIQSGDTPVDGDGNPISALTDPEVAALASVVSAANKLFYFTGLGTGAVTDFFAVARTLVGQTTQALMRTTGLGSTTVGDAVFIAASALAAQTALTLVPGTDVQAYNANLAALAGLTSAADKLGYFTGLGTAATTTLSSVARTLIAQTTQALMRTTGLGSTVIGDGIFVAADAAAVRTLLSLVIGTNVQAWSAALDTWAGKTAPSGTVVGTSDVQTMTGKIYQPRVVAITDQATLAVNADTTDIATVTVAASRTLGAPSGTPFNGQKFILRIKQDGTGSWTLAYNAIFRFSVDLPSPTLTTTAGALDRLAFEYESATPKWDFVGKVFGT